MAAADKRGSVGAKHARRYCTPDWLACCAFSEAEVMVCWEHGERVGGSRLRHATRARCHRRLQLVEEEEGGGGAVFKRQSAGMLDER